MRVSLMTLFDRFLYIDSSDIRLPLNSQVKGNEDAILILKVRKPSSREIGMWAATYAMELDEQRRLLLNGKDGPLDGLSGRQ